MARSQQRMPMKPIADEKARDITFRKRKETLDKKIYEFTTLCDVKACMIYCGPDNKVETWPKERKEVEAIVREYKLSGHEEREKQKQSLLSFFEAEKRCLQMEVNRMRSERFEKMFSTGDNWFDDLNVESLRNIAKTVESKLEIVEERIEVMQAKRKGAKKRKQEEEKGEEKGKGKGKQIAVETGEINVHESPALSKKKNDDMVNDFGRKPSISLVPAAAIGHPYNPMVFDAQRAVFMPSCMGTIVPLECCRNGGSSSSAIPLTNGGFGNFVGAPMFAQPQALQVVMPAFVLPPPSQPHMHQFGNRTFNYNPRASEFNPNPTNF